MGELKAVRFDFSKDTSANLSAPTVTVSVLKGTDASPNNVKVSDPVVVGQEVVQKIQPGVVGCTYKLRCLVTDADGLKHALSGVFSVDPA